MTWERIPLDEWRSQHGHIERYQMATDLINDGDVVIDAACGIGYGAAVITARRNVTYFGVDRATAVARDFMHCGWFTAADLNTWQPSFPFDVGVCFETLEHLQHPERLAAALCEARRAVIVSVPTVPTKHMNEWHLHDFTVDSLVRLFPSYNSVEVIEQPAELSHIFIFRM